MEKGGPEYVGSLAEAFERDLRELFDEVGIKPIPPNPDDHGFLIDPEIFADPVIGPKLLELLLTWINSLAYQVDHLTAQLRKR